MLFRSNVIELLKERLVVEFRLHSRHGFTGQPAALVVGIKDLEVVAFDFDHQPQLGSELELVTVVFRSAVNEVADVDGVLFQCYRLLTAQTKSGIASRSICALAPHEAQFGSRRILNVRKDIDSAS